MDCRTGMPTRKRNRPIARPMSVRTKDESGALDRFSCPRGGVEAAVEPDRQADHAEDGAEAVHFGVPREQAGHPDQEEEEVLDAEGEREGAEHADDNSLRT